MLAPSVLVATGLAVAFAGRRLYWFAAGVVGFSIVALPVFIVHASWQTATTLGAPPLEQSTMYAILFGIIGAFVFIAAMKLFIAGTGFVIGSVAYIIVGTGFDGWMMFIIGIVGAFIALALHEIMIVVSTSVMGAGFVAFGYLLYEFRGIGWVEFVHVYVVENPYTLLILLEGTSAVFVVTALAGMAFQFGWIHFEKGLSSVHPSKPDEVGEARGDS